MICLTEIHRWEHSCGTWLRLTKLILDSAERLIAISLSMRDLKEESYWFIFWGGGGVATAVSSLSPSNIAKKANFPNCLIWENARWRIAHFPDEVIGEA